GLRGPDAAELRHPVDRDEVLRQLPLSLPGAHDEVRAAGDDPGAAPKSIEDLVNRGRCREGRAGARAIPAGTAGAARLGAARLGAARLAAHLPGWACACHRRHRRASWTALHTRCGVAGSCRTRAPVATAMAFAIAPGVGMQGGSPRPFEPLGPASGAGMSMKPTLISGTSAIVWSL